MKAVLMRTGSVPVQLRSPPVSGSPRPSLGRSGSFSGEKTSKAISLSSEASRGRDRPKVRRASSAIEISGRFRSFPAGIPEEDDLDLPRASTLGSWPEIGAPAGESGFRGGGFGDKRGDQRGVGEYYERMLKKNPGDARLLRNYGKFLHEVLGDWARAEECYGRAILASDGGDGELFSLYGRLIWESQRDLERAKSYFDQAISVSPDDCTVLGSYARFMWEAEEEDEDEDEDGTEWNVPPSPALVPAL